MLSKSPYNAAEAAHQAVELPLQEGSQWQTPAGFALFTAEFGRDGSDLILQGEDGTVLRLADYFDGGAPAEILSHDGASLAGRVVDRLAGPLFPGQYAQAGGFDLAQAIGQVETLTGSAFVQRTDGTTEALDVGIKVFAGDVVRTEGGSTLSITFADGTIFTLAEGSRMVLDELIYDPDATDNKGVFDLVQGGFVFIAGQAASTGGIEINTPAATMGIRGTTVKVDIQLRNGESIVTVSLNTDPDGGTGVIELRDLDGNLIANITQTDTKWIIEPPGTGVPPIEVDRTDLDFAQDSPLLTEAAAAFQLALSRVQQGENFVELPEGNAIDDDQDDDEGEGDGVDPPPTVPPLDETGDDGGTGESGTGNPELDGQDDPLPDGNADTDTEDDAFLDGGEPTTPGSGGDSNPIVTVTSIRSVEDTPFAGNLGVTSNSPDVTVSLTQGAQNGQVVLLSDGTFTYIPNPDFEGTDTFIVTATEPDGSSTESEITVQVDPVNDAPVVASLQDFGSTFEIGANSEGGSTPAQGTVAYSDVDEGATPGTWSISAAPQNATALGTISIDPTSGAWQYDLDQGAADPLAEGEQVVETYLATITDAEGASDTSTVEVTITGSNDGPVITSSAAQAALGEDVFGFSIEDPESEEDPGEAPSETLATGSVSGSFTFFDVDQGETQGQWSIAPSDDNQTTFGSATIDPVTGEWLYTLDQMAADVLGNGDQATEVFIATVTDEFGATASQSITITVTGFNDAPTIEFSIEDITGTVFEEGYVAPDPESESAFQFARFAAMTLEEADATGTLTYTDPDAQPGAQASWAVAPLDASLGTMVIDEITGQWHYFLDQSAAQTLAEGEERTETFTATVTDADGGSSSQVITITVVGSNDEAQIIASPEDLAGAVTEGGALIAQGQLTFVDADAAPGEVSTWSISADGVSRGTMIIDPATGAWTYSLDEALANSIGEGDQVTETYTAALTDPLGAVALQTIQITITGENDGPVITSAQLDGTVRETGTTNPGISSISGTLTAVDPDQDGTNLNWQIAPEAGNETALGDMSIDGLSGEWTYLLNNFAADSLALGQSATESFTATVTDAFGASQSTTVVITIEGSADAPVLSADSRTLSEETAEIRVDLAALASDVDNGQDGSTLTYSLLNSPTQGLARIEGTELVFETAGDFDTLIEGQTASVVLNLLATDADGLTATSSISFTVIGTNGAPVFSDASVTLVEETTATLSLDLANLADDPDAGEDGTTLTYSIVNAPTGGSVTLLGTILTFDPGTDFEDLPSGESRAVTVDLRATDVDGETATATVTVTVTGANDGPEILATSQTGGSVTEPGAPSASNPVTVSGQLFYSDPDEGTTSGTWTITPAGTALSAMTIDPASGQWTYSLDQAAADSLNAGEVRTETFTATVTDVFGADASEEVQITITGTNDAPLLQSDSRLIEGEQGSVTFDLEALASDIDSADLDGTLTFSILTAPSEGNATLDPAGRTLTYATGSDFDDLAEGQTATATITVQVSDSNGASTTADMTVTVTGTNDAPVITSNAAAAAGTVVEPGFEEPGTLSATGQLTYSDVDEGETSGTWSVTPAAPGSLGTIAINAASGQWTYTLNPASADALDAGDSVTETFEAIYTDAFGAATAPQILAITIEGTNDAPLMTAATLTVDEDTAGTIDLRTLTTDPDASDDPSNDITFGLSGPTEKGTASIVGGILSFDPDGDFDDLAVGDSEEVVLGITLSDPAGGTSTSTVTITVTGANDGPVITSGPTDAAGTAIESGEGPATPAIVAADATGQLSYVDPDETPTTLGSWSVDAIGPSYGTMNIDGETGAWSYFLSPTLSDSLRQGETVEDRWTAVITDAEGAQAMEVITITITGTNDAPVIDDVTSLTDRGHTEGGPTTLTGQLVANDPDTFVDAPTWTITRADDIDVEEQTYGTMAINNDGLWTYTVDPEAVDMLGEGETAMETFRATVRDEFGQTDEVTVKVRFAGTNSAPELVVDISETDLNVSEAGDGREGSPVAVGQLSYFDNDEGETNGTWSITPTGETTYGSVSINPLTGQWRYELDQEKADSLTEGEQVTETFSATYTDAFGASTAALPLSITITGTNDAPLLQSDSRLIEGEQGSVTFDLEALASDIDSADLDGTLTFSILTAPSEGNATLDPAGRTLTYATGSDFDDLAEGQTATATITVQVSDSNGASTTADMTVTVTGTNDAPVITSNAAAAAGTVVEPGFEEPGTLSATGQLTYSDVDEGETSGTWSVTPAAPGSLGTIAINAASGQWTYTLNPASADALDAGDSVTETFEAIYTDAFGAATAPQILAITIEGTNDAPLMTAATLTVDEDTAGTIDLRTLTTDPDASDDPSNDITFGLSGPTEKGTASIVGGILSFDPDGDFDDLAVGDSEEVVLGITLSDPAGGTSTSTVTITVTGANDGPVITSGPTDAAGTAIESGEGPATPAIVAADATGQLSYVDPDETPTTLGSWSVDAIGPSYGTMNIDGETGAWSYFLSPTLSDSLRQGETVEDRWTAVITDAEGAQAMEVITITITGTNDAPVIDDVTSLTDRGHTEGGPTTLTGQLVANDPDTFVDAPTWTITRADDIDVEEQTYGTMAINNDGLWTYTVDPEAVDMLGEGETAMETFRATVRDEFGQTDEVTVKVRFAGTNSAPELVVDISETDLNVSEAGDGREGSPVAVGQLSYFDNDEGETNGTWSITPTGETTYGSVSINPLTGQWRYELDQEKADSLTEGEQVTETFSATYTDAFGASTAALPLSITITGTNDAPLLQSDSRLIEGEQGSVTFDLEALASDIDSADLDGTLTFSILTAPSEGNATLDPAGRTLTYATGSDFDDLAEGQTATATITVQVSDSNGASTTADMTVTVTGTNDAPVITSNAAAAAGTVVEPGFEEPGTLSATGQLTYSDVDEGETSGTWSVTPAAPGSLGTIAINAASGQWTYTLNPASADALDAGDSVTETFEAIYTDAFGAATAPQILAITIEGTNDAPLMTAATLTVDEDTAGTIDLRTLTTDPDASDDPSNDITFGLSGPTEKGTASIVGGILSFDPDGDFDDLAVGDSEEVVLGITLSDPAGGTSTSTVTITVTGANDGPVITSGPTDAAGTAIESGEGPATPAIVAADATGQLSYVDPDETPTTLGSWSVDAIGPSYGTMNIDGETGAWSYFLSPTLSDSLRQGETVEDRWTAVITDAEGAQAMEVITITITGTNDAPVIDDVTSLTDRGHTEGGPTTLTGQLVANDPDTFVDAPTWTITRADDIDVEEQTYGTMAINNDGLWSYTVDPEAVDMLGEGETAMETFRATVRDEFGQTDEVTVKVRFAGTNSAPELVVDISETDLNVSEAGDGREGSPVAVGQLSYFDNDEGETNGTWSITPTGETAYGSVSINPLTGQWRYELDQEKADSLTEGEQVTETFSATYTDAFGASTAALPLSITISGSNDAPTLTASDLAVSQGGSSSVDLSPLAADVDHALADLTFSISSPPAKGAATITDGGELTFTTEGAFARLGDGATEEVDISVLVADPDGATVTQTVTVTVTGTNDAPEIDSDAETFDVSDTLAETDSALTTSGEFYVTDIDEGDIVTVTGITLAAAGVLNGAAANDDPTLLGYFSTSPGTVIDAETDSGPLSWTWNSGSEAFDYLATNETLVLTYNIALADDATPPGQVTQEVVITIEGTNDAPVITGSATAALTETADTTGDSATLTATDRLDFSDADLSDVDHTATVSGVTITGASGGLPGNAALLGLLSLTAAKSPSGTDGTIDWTFTAEDQTFDYLAKDETVTLSYEVTLSDGNDGTDTTTVAVTVTGTNDAVTTSIGFPDAHRLYEYTDDNPLEGTLRTTSDEWYRASDDTWVEGVYDGGGFHVYDVDIADDVSFSVAPLGADYITDYQVHDFEQTTPTSWFLSWSYEVDDSALDFLTEGEVRTETFRVTLDDGNGGGTTRDFVIELVGTNDAPTLSTATLNADENSTDTTLDLTLLGDDVDSDDDGESLTYSIVSGPEEGTVSIEEGVLSFDANGDFEDLGEGETRTVTVDLLATDSHSATSEIVPFSIVVTGVNSAAVITGALSGVITEDEVPNTVGGDLDSVDPDTSDADDLWEVPEGTISTTYGSATYDTSGNWVYTLDNSDPAITGMSAGDSLTDSFSAFTIDGTEQVVNITIDGADDAALIDGDTTDSVAEDDAIPLASGNLDHTDDDDDDPDDLWAAAGPGATTDNGYGTFEITTTGQWTYTLDGTNTDVRALNAEDTLTDTFTVNTSDGTDQLITVTIDGANDEATISGDLSGTAFEDGASAEGDINHEDPDDADDAWTPQASIAATYGTLSINAAGEWEYTVDNANSVVNALNVSDTLSDSVLVTTTGGTEATINVTIAGANDAAIVLDTSTDTGSVNEDSSTITITGDLNHTDVDNANDLWVAQGPTDIDYGRYSVNTNGFWIFTLFNANAETNALGDSDTATTNFVATTLDGTTQTVTITINGADDPVEITGDFTGVATEDAEEESVYGNLDYTDVDAGGAEDEWVGVEVGFSDRGYGTYQIDESGNWTFSLDNGNTDVNALGEADSLTDTFTVSATDGTEQEITITIEGSNDGPVAMSETATLTLDKGMFDPTGWSKHGDNYYQFIPPNAITSEFTWEDARAAAAAMGGHLATVTSASENAFLQSLHFNPTGWLGASDAGAEGTWIWVEGPEAGQQFWQGGTGGNVVGGLYANWNIGQPDDVTNEDYLHTFSTGAWNDINDSSAMGFFVEYSGPQATGSVAGNDVSIDGGSLTYTLEGEDVIDGLTLFADGSWTYDLDSSAFESLNDGQTTSVSTTYTVTDENGETDTATLTLEITGINDAAVIVGDTTGSVTEDDATDTVSGSLTHTDADSGDNDSVFQDVSVQTASANGYGTYTIGTGTTGGIWTYRLDNTNTAVNELLDGESLTDSFTVLAEDGTEQEITITIEGENDAPVVTAGAVLAYTENDAAMPIDDGIALSDADGTQLEGATVAITGGFQSGEDSLSFVDQNGITGSYSTATGVLTLAGTATLAQYEAALQSVAYANSSDAPSEVDRTISFTVNGGIVASATVTSTVAVAAVNDAPVIDTVTSDLAGVLTSFIEDRLPTTSAVSEAPSFVRAPTIYGGGYPYEKFAGVAFDPVTGKVYESVGVDRYTESAVRVFADTASFEAGTVLTTINLGTASNGSSTDIHGTYFSAYDDVLIGKSGGASDFEGKKEIAFWNATNGAVLNEITPIPGVLTIGQTNYGFNWGGHTGISVIQDSSGIYALGKTASSTWALAEIDPVSQSVVGTEFFNAGNQGFAFAVEGLIFFGDYNTGYVSKVYNIGANTLSNVNISLNARGGTNDYWSNTSYDIATDTLYMVNSPNSTNGLIYKIENISGLVLTPSMLPTGKIVFDDPDTMNVFAVHDVTVTEPDSTPYFGSLTVGAPVATSATEYEVSWEYHISQADYDSLAAGQTITENFEVTINDGGLNGTDSETVTIVTTGINDAAVISGDTTGSVTEDDATDTVSGSLTHTDADSNNDDSVFQIVTLASNTASDGGYGTYAVDGSGNWTFTLDNGNATVNALRGGDTISDSFDVLAEDGTAETVEVTIVGTNDKPVITNDASLTLNVRESGVDTAGILTDSATMTVTDPDMTTGGTWSFQTLSTNFFSSISHTPATGFWSYTLNDASIVVDRLGEGQTGTDTFRRTYTDEQGLASDTVDMTVIVTGSNDAAVVSGVLDGTVTEDFGNDSISGDAAHTDIDLNNNNDVWDADSGNTTYGSFTVTSGGFWTYSLDDSTPALDTLDSGQTAMDSFVIVTEDGTEQTIEITINGSDETAALVATDDDSMGDAISVLLLGENNPVNTIATANQLNGANPNRFNFAVSTVDLQSAPAMAWTAGQWQSLFNSADVVLLGGYDPTYPTYFTNLTGLQQLEAYYQAGGNIVTTGRIHEGLEDTSGTANTLLDTITPVTTPIGGFPSDNQIDVLQSTIHPITDDIDDFVFTNEEWTGTDDVDVGTIKLGLLNGVTGVHAISAKEGTGAQGNLAFLGGRYMDNAISPTHSAELRTGDPDYLLEQALAWAAGVDKVYITEDAPHTFDATDLLANDTAGASLIGVSGVSARGATVTLLGGNVNYNPLSSPALDDLNDDQTLTDTFTYTISDGSTSDTATVTVTVNGITDADAPPELLSSEMNGFALAFTNQYRFAARFSDDDNGTGITYTLHNGTAPIEVPSGVSYNSTNNNFTFTAAAQTDYTDGLGIYGYEADGQYKYVPIGYSVNGDGDLRFFYSEFDETDGGPVLEIAFENVTGSDTVTIDLSGIEALAPDVLKDTAVLDLRNGQESILDIDVDDLLNLIEGNNSTETEEIVIQSDSFNGDSVYFLDDDATGTDQGYIATEATTDTWHLTRTGPGGAGDAFDGFATHFATIFIDDGISGEA